MYSRIQLSRWPKVPTGTTYVKRLEVETIELPERVELCHKVCDHSCMHFSQSRKFFVWWISNNLFLILVLVIVNDNKPFFEALSHCLTTSDVRLPETDISVVRKLYTWTAAIVACERRRWASADTTWKPCCAACCRGGVCLSLHARWKDIPSVLISDQSFEKQHICKYSVSFFPLLSKTFGKSVCMVSASLFSGEMCVRVDKPIRAIHALVSGWGQHVDSKSHT